MSEVRNDETELSPEEIEAREEAAFTAGGAGEPDPTPVEEPEPKPDAEPVPDKDPEPEPETYTAEDLDRARRAALEEGRIAGAAEEKQEHTKRIRDLSGQVGGLKQKLAQLETARAASSDKADSPTDTQVSEATRQGGSKLEALREDFPEIAEAIDEIRSQLTPPKAPEPEPDPEPETPAPEPEEDDGPSEQERMRTQLEIYEAHSDWREVVRSDEFQAWVAQQSDEVRAAYESSPRAKDAISILNMFKSSMTPPKRKPDTSRLESAVTPTEGKSVTRPKPLTEEEAFEAGFKAVR